jgi:hypothetical protein
MVYHYGVFKFHPGTTPSTIDNCFKALKGMVGKIPGLLSVESGPYESDEGLNEGFTHGFVMKFDSPKNRDDYLPHPEHERVKAIVVPNLAHVIVFDFVV